MKSLLHSRWCSEFGWKPRACKLGVFLHVTCLVIKLDPKLAIQIGLTLQIYTEREIDCKKAFASAAKFLGRNSCSHENPINQLSGHKAHVALQPPWDDFSLGRLPQASQVLLLPHSGPAAWLLSGRNRGAQPGLKLCYFLSDIHPNPQPGRTPHLTAVQLTCTWPSDEALCLAAGTNGHPVPAQGPESPTRRSTWFG